MSMRRKDDSSLVTTRADGAPMFPHAQIENHVDINLYDYTCLITYVDEVVQTLDGFKVIESHTMINLDDKGDDS